MKKLILKTIFITCGIALMLLFAVFGIVSLWAPSAMMNFTASLGMETVSGDYAFQEYERSGNISCLARSFLIASRHKDDRNADQRFEILFGLEGFGEFCESQNTSGEGVPAVSYRSYLCGQAAEVKYRLAKTAEEKEAVCSFAVEETTADFPSGNPVIALTLALAEAKDGTASDILLTKISGKGFEQNLDYRNIINILEAVE